MFGWCCFRESKESKLPKGITFEDNDTFWDPKKLNETDKTGENISNKENIDNKEAVGDKEKVVEKEEPRESTAEWLKQTYESVAPTHRHSNGITKWSHGIKSGNTIENWSEFNVNICEKIEEGYLFGFEVTLPNIGVIDFTEQHISNSKSIYFILKRNDGRVGIAKRGNIPLRKVSIRNKKKFKIKPKQNKNRKTIASTLTDGEFKKLLINPREYAHSVEEFARNTSNVPDAYNGKEMHTQLSESFRMFMGSVMDSGINLYDNEFEIIEEGNSDSNLIRKSASTYNFYHRETSQYTSYMLGLP